MNFAPPELLGGLLLPRLFSAVREAGLPPGTIVVEVTEDSFLADPERTRSVLAEIRQHQVQISIDDYGTGFSSLSYLRDLPVQELKMDRSFVSAVTTDRRTRMIVASTNQMAQALGLRMVAEGVEDDRTAIEMVAHGRRRAAGLPHRPPDAAGRGGAVGTPLGHPGGRRSRATRPPGRLTVRRPAPVSAPARRRHLRAAPRRARAA